MNNNFVIKFHYIYHNYKPNSKDYDERGLGVHFIQGQWYAVIQRTYFCPFLLSLSFNNWDITFPKSTG